MLFREQLADVVIYLQVSHRIGPGTLPYRVLVHIFHPCHPIKVAGQLPEHARKVPGLVDSAVQGGVQYIPNKGGFPGTADPGHRCKHPERELYVDILKVVLHGTFYGYGICPGTLLAHIALPFPTQILEGQGFCPILVAGSDAALEDYPASVHSRLRSHVYQHVRSSDDFFIVLHHDHGVSYVPKVPQD